jgi:ParB family chromosome partitioning protein
VIPVCDQVGTVVLMQTRKLLPYKLNPRKEFRGIDRLAKSIKEDGIADPLLARLLPEGSEVVEGERRLRAALQAGIPKVPAIIRDFNDKQVIELCLIQDIEGENLSEVEKGLDQSTSNSATCQNGIQISS